VGLSRPVAPRSDSAPGHDGPIERFRDGPQGGSDASLQWYRIASMLPDFAVRKPGRAMAAH
jgi:hypothetical protein